MKLSIHFRKAISCFIPIPTIIFSWYKLDKKKTYVYVEVYWLFWYITTYKDLTNKENHG